MLQSADAVGKKNVDARNTGPGNLRTKSIVTVGLSSEMRLRNVLS